MSRCGGYGDPLERNPELVLSHGRNQKTNADHARTVYGVVIKEVRKAIDEPATKRLRDELRKRRLLDNAALISVCQREDIEDGLRSAVGRPDLVHRNPAGGLTEKRFGSQLTDRWSEVNSNPQATL